jgi:hypothetical protein
MAVASRREWFRYRSDILNIAQAAAHLDQDASPESTVTVLAE